MKHTTTTATAEEQPTKSAALFMTHHAPIGAWSSLTFGLPGGGVGIETEALGVQASGDLIVACSHGAGRTIALPFFTAKPSDDYEGKMAGTVSPRAFESWRVVASGEITRTLGPAVDEFAASGMRFRVTSPRSDLELGEDGATDVAAVLPALLLELEIDNLDGDEAATGFLGLAYAGAGRMRPLDWSAPDLAGVAFQDRWALAARKEADVFTVRSGDIARWVEAGAPVIHPGGNQGGVAFRIPPGQKRTLVAAFGFYRGGSEAVQGLAAAYAYTRHFPTVEAVCRHALVSANLVRAAARRIEEAWRAWMPDPLHRAMMAQVAQGYYANTSLIREERGPLRWSVCEGQFAWRNTLDLAVDHLPFELAHHPCVVRNIVDGFIERYTYHDTVRFDGDAPGQRPGGISFTHDQGNYTAYSPPGYSGYEQTDKKGVYAYMTTEQLLNGVYCSAGYAIAGGDRAWAESRLGLARVLVTSMENREHFDPLLRDGILRAQSARAGLGREVTTYDALDHALQDSCGSIYIVVKTWCAALMLRAWMESAGDAAGAASAGKLADRTARTLEKAFREDAGSFPPNLLEGGESMVFAALDPLAVPIYCGLGADLRRYPGVLGCLVAHARSCLQPGICLDAKSGGLRLSSTSENTWPSKIALCLASLAWLVDAPATGLAPTAWEQFVRWLQVSSARQTVSDQINVETGVPLGGAYYPRLVTAWLLFAPIEARVFVESARKGASGTNSSKANCDVRVRIPDESDVSLSCAGRT